MSLTCPRRSKVSPVGDGNGDGPEDEGDDGEQQHRPREGRLVLGVPTAIAEANILWEFIQYYIQKLVYSISSLEVSEFESRNESELCSYIFGGGQNEKQISIVFQSVFPLRVTNIQSIQRILCHFCQFTSPLFALFHLTKWAHCSQNLVPCDSNHMKIHIDALVVEWLETSALRNPWCFAENPPMLHRSLHGR